MRAKTWGALALLLVLFPRPVFAGEAGLDVRNDTCEPTLSQWAKLPLIGAPLLVMFNDRRRKAVGCLYAKMRSGTFALLMLDAPPGSLVPPPILKERASAYDYHLERHTFWARGSEGEWWEATPPARYINYYGLLQRLSVSVHGAPYVVSLLVSWRKDREIVKEEDVREFLDELLSRIKLKRPAP